MKEYSKALENAGVLPVKLLIEYLQLVMKWNDSINITGSKTAEDFAAKHIADVYNALKTIERPSRNIVDVGSGGGVPGIPLAIMCPDIRVVLVERRQKKANVLQSMVDTLKLNSRVTVQSKPFEEINNRYDENYEFWFRGFLPGPKLAKYFSESFPKGDLENIVLMKGPNWPLEKASIMQEPSVRKVWMERFASSMETGYSLPHELGTRLLVFV